MRPKTTIGLILCLLCVGMWLSSDLTEVHGARVAGEEGVTPTAPEAAQPPPEQPPAVMPPEQPPTVPPSEQPPVAGPPEPAPPPERRAQPPVPPPDTRERPRPTPAPLEETPDERYVTIDFDDVDIALFIKFISELTGKNFVVDKAVRGKVTIISPTKISVKEAYKVFESVLEVHGFTTVPSGSVVKIVPSVEARSKNIETRLRKEAIDPEDKVVTQLIPLEYANPDELKKLFAPLISKSSVMVSYPPTGMLIVTDVLSNIKRLLSIVKAIDVVGIGEEITVVPLENATATVIVKSITSVFQAKRRRKGAPPQDTVKVVADERTNSLIISATEDDTLKVKQLIELLDREVPRGEGDIRVYYLQNADAEDLAQVLTALPSKQTTAAEKGKAPIISKEVQIVADKATNSLVITSNRDDYAILEDVIERLDIPRRMVYIEALLMEVSVDKRFALGVRWQAADEIGSYDDRSIGGFTASVPPDVNIPTIDPVTATGVFPPGFTVGVLGEAIEIGGIEFPNLLAVVNAFRNDSDVHIISTPQIMTMDNEEAEIVVADNIPFLTRQETTAANIDYSSYEFKDVGTTLKITPQINQERFVRLEIYNQLAQVVDQEQAGLPTTLKREAKTTVVIRDGHTVVIGGLIDETLSQTTYKTPCLGDVPFFGWLFKSKLDKSDRTNLFIFITPRIVENPLEANVIYEDKKGVIDRVRMGEGVIKMYEKPRPEDEETETHGTEGEETEGGSPAPRNTESKPPASDKMESEKTE